MPKAQNVAAEADNKSTTRASSLDLRTKVRCRRGILYVRLPALTTTPSFVPFKFTYLQVPQPTATGYDRQGAQGVRVDPEERQWHATVVHGRGVLEPYRHPRTHGVPAAFIQFRAHHPEPIQLAAHFASHAAASFGIPILGVVSLPTRRTLWTENFERRVHTRAIKAFDADAEVVDRYRALALQSVVGRMHLGKATNRQKVKELGDEIVEVESQAAKQSA
ncbi:hypothetical protein BJV78DRAFT_1287117 [Lactifluus subvellereus]|nr:hypothetical protein BJV78DRAFT_1287117 [Lactifluus subvellereus]